MTSPLPSEDIDTGQPTEWHQILGRFRDKMQKEAEEEKERLEEEAKMAAELE